MKSSFIKFLHAEISVLFLVFILLACSKPDQVIPGPPKELHVEAEVPAKIYSNIKHIYLNASRTEGLNGKRLLIFNWTCTEFPSSTRAPRIVSPAKAMTMADSLAVGKYQFLLSVKDNLGNKVEQSYALEVLEDTLKNFLPVAKAGPDMEIRQPQYSIELNGDETYLFNPLNRDLIYRWSVISQPPGSPRIYFSDSTHNYTLASGFVEGSYQFRLEVENEFGLKAADTMKVRVLPDPLKGLTMIFEDQVWKWGDGDWGAFVFLDILDSRITEYRETINTEVRLWDEEKKEWSDPGKYSWYALPGEMLIYYPVTDTSVLGKKEKVQVKFL